VSRRVIVFGNSGSGKSTLAAQLSRAEGLAHLDLDTLAWLPTDPPTRRPIEDSADEIVGFTAQHDAWVIEGCYTDLLAMVRRAATEMVFLNPGVEACVAHCRARPWEPHKYATRVAQDANLAMLIGWVRGYPSRSDTCSLVAHRALYDAFEGPKREVREAGMQATAEQVAGARFYETLFVPALMAPFAPILADAAGVREGVHVLDVACGTGVVAREALRRVGPTGRVVGLDRNPGMLAVAGEQAPSIQWRDGTAESLPFPEASFDAVTSQFGLMFMDRPRALAEMRRVLRPGGRLAVAVWASIESMPLFAQELRLIARLCGEAAADALRAPFSLGDRAALAALAPDAEITTHTTTARFPSLRSIVEADLRGWMPIMRVHLDEATIVQTLAAADAELPRYVTTAPDGSVTFPTSAHVLSERKAG
jgi:SAM-dependent methyltransferase